MMNFATPGAVPPPNPQALAVSWGTLLIVLAGIAVFMLMIRGLGIVLAQGHAPPRPAPPPLPPVSPGETPKSVLDPEMVALVSAVLSTVFHQSYRITKIESGQQDYSVEALMNIWSMEGRRQIYDSHKIR